jgi:hypothetical protein
MKDLIQELRGVAGLPANSSDAPDPPNTATGQGAARSHPGNNRDRAPPDPGRMEFRHEFLWISTRTRRMFEI